MEEHRNFPPSNHQLQFPVCQTQGLVSHSYDFRKRKRAWTQYPLDDDYHGGYRPSEIDDCYRPSCSDDSDPEAVATRVSEDGHRNSSYDSHHNSSYDNHHNRNSKDSSRAITTYNSPHSNRESYPNSRARIQNSSYRGGSCRRRPIKGTLVNRSCTPPPSDPHQLNDTPSTNASNHTELAGSSLSTFGNLSVEDEESDEEESVNDPSPCITTTMANHKARTTTNCKAHPTLTVDTAIDTVSDSSSTSPLCAPTPRSNVTSSSWSSPTPPPPAHAWPTNPFPPLGETAPTPGGSGQSVFSIISEAPSTPTKGSSTTTQPLSSLRKVSPGVQGCSPIRRKLTFVSLRTKPSPRKSPITPGPRQPPIKLSPRKSPKVSKVMNVSPVPKNLCFAQRMLREKQVADSNGVRQGMRVELYVMMERLRHVGRLRAIKEERIKALVDMRHWVDTHRARGEAEVASYMRTGKLPAATFTTSPWVTGKPDGVPHVTNHGDALPGLICALEFVDDQLSEARSIKESLENELDDLKSKVLAIETALR